MDIEESVGRFLGVREAGQRYASFDYCFNYFQEFREQDRIAEIAAGPNMQLSCLQLGFYLASWGMFRASSRLPGSSLAQFRRVVEVIATTAPATWEIDAHCYSAENQDQLVRLAARIQDAFPHHVTPTLITKIILGVFGSIPALDQFVTSGLRKEGIGTSLSPATLDGISRFYDAHAGAIDRHRVPAYDFGTGQPGCRRYTRAKVIDMIFFIRGGGRASRP
jgi:hypothetical protein